MIRKIILENFMSHKRTVIEPAEGLTLITGENNCGKSAVAIALEAVGGQTIGPFMLRHGEKEAKVILEVENEDGMHTLEWRRKEKTQGWSIDNLGSDRGKPDNLDNVLRLPEIESETGNHKFKLHIASQKNPIFLLDDPGSRAAEFFAGSGDAVYLISMQNKHRGRGREKKGRKGFLETEIKKLESQLKKLESVPSIRTDVDEAKKKEAELITKEDERVNLDQLIKKFEISQSVSEDKTKCLDVLKSLAAPPDLDDTNKIKETINQIRSANNRQKSATEKLDRLSLLKPPPEQDDTKSVQRKLDQLREAAAKVKEFTQKKDASTVELEEVSQHFEKLVSEGVACDRCGAPLTLKHLTRNIHEPNAR